MRLLVTAGPTREPIDPVRFISNRSSGKMGYAVARAALARGHQVCLISGPVHIPPPAAARLMRVETAEEMLKAVRDNLAESDALVMAAAVADWRPAAPQDRKAKKSQMPASLAIESTPDILKTVRGLKGGRIFVGFAAETGDPLAEARRKLADKGLDLIVANDVSKPGSGFDTDTNQVTLIAAGGAVIALPLMTKDDVAERIISWIEAVCYPPDRIHLST